MEEKLVALQRECKEEIGCEVVITGAVGEIVEYRKFAHLKQVSYCYLAKVKGEKGMPHFINEEIQKGFEVVWMAYKDALDAMVKSKPADTESRDYIVPRDTTLLLAAKALL